MGKYLQNESIFIPEGGKLLFYTDGLTEAIPVNEPESADYETARLETILQEGAGFSPGHLVKFILEDLTHFRKTRTFEDDVCLICVEHKGKNV